MNKDAGAHDSSEKQSKSPPAGQVLTIAIVVTVAVAYQLYRTALVTGNYEGLWFSLAHTVIVAVGVVCALRPACLLYESDKL